MMNAEKMYQGIQVLEGFDQPKGKNKMDTWQRKVEPHACLSAY